MGKAEQAVKAVASADKRLTHRAARARKHPLMKAVAFLAEGADQPPLIIASVGTLAIGIAARRGDLTRGGVRMLASHLLATAVKTAIKHQFDRNRPGHALDGAGAHFDAGHSDEHEENSFPSGHTAGAVAVARAASREIDGAAIPATIATVAVAAAQAPAGNHYLSDVVAGAAIGWVTEAIVAAVFDRVEPPIERALTAAA